MADSSSGSWFRWLVGAVIAFLAAGSGIVALLNYWNGRDSADREVVRVEPAPGEQEDGQADPQSGGEVVAVSPLRMQGENFEESAQGVQTLEMDGVRFLGYVTDGTWTTYSTAGLGAGTIDAIEARVASDSDGGTLLLRVDSAAGRQIGECQAPGTGGWTNWETVSCTVAGDAPEDMSQLYVEFRGSGTPYLVNVDWIEIR